MVSEINASAVKKNRLSYTIERGDLHRQDLMHDFDPGSFAILPPQF